MIKGHQETLRQVNVRFPAPDRERLARLAAREQRTLSQLVRWAVALWLDESPTVGTPALTAMTDQAGPGLHVNVKLPVETRQRLLLVSGDGTVSTPIRCAVTWWLDLNDEQARHGSDPQAVV